MNLAVLSTVPLFAKLQYFMLCLMNKKNLSSRNLRVPSCSHYSISVHYEICAMWLIDKDFRIWSQNWLIFLIGESPEIEECRRKCFNDFILSIFFLTHVYSALHCNIYSWFRLTILIIFLILPDYYLYFAFKIHWIKWFLLFWADDPFYKLCYN